MKSFCHNLLSFSVLLFLSGISSALWPIPRHYEHGDTVLWISSDVSITHNLRPEGDVNILEELVIYQNSDAGISYPDDLPPSQNPTYTTNDSAPDTPSAQSILTAAIQRAKSTIFKHSIIPWKFRPRNWTSPILDSSSTYITTLVVEQLLPNPEKFLTAGAGEVDESYTLTISEEGAARITAKSTFGLLHGLTTFTQLFYSPSSSDPLSNSLAYTPLAPISIHDSPLFPHRGLNLDVSRTWIPVPTILRTISALASSKLNVLHLHITDSQSWPLEVPSLPLLAKKGAYQPHLTYSPADFDKIHRYAAYHGVRVITEIDMPGHTSSVWHAYPELVAAYNKQPNWNTYAAEPPSGTLKLNSSAVENWLDDLFADVLPRVSPWTGYWHSGGDEVNREAYTLDDTVRSKDFKVLKPLMQAFVGGVHRRVREKGLSPIVWEEMVLEWGLDLGKDTVVQAWRSSEAVKKVVEKGYRVVVGNYKSWYLDCGKGQWLDQSTSTSSSDPDFLDYCAPYHNWRAIYTSDPLADIPSHLSHLVLGGETHIWGEMTDEVNLDSMVWPRAASAGEVLWSGNQLEKEGEGEGKGFADVSRRLGEWRERVVVGLGVRADVVQMPFCTMGEGMCPG